MAHTMPQGHARLSIHSWLVHHEGQIILINTGAGNDKSLPNLEMLDHLQNPYLERLAAAGVRREDVNYVLLTHIHADHVGWNAWLHNGKWEPTFPNALVVCSSLESQYGAALAEGDEAAIQTIRQEAGFGEPGRVPVPGVFEDSMIPLHVAARVRLVHVNGKEVLPGIRFVSTGGHSIDNAAIEISSDGALGVFGGDVMHHPLEVYDPELVSAFCEFPQAARRSRLRLLKQMAECGALYFSSHFTLTSAGYIDRRNDGFGWTFTDA